MNDYSTKPIRVGMLPDDRWKDVTDDMIERIEKILKDPSPLENQEYITCITGDIYNGNICVYITVCDEKYIDMVPGTIDGLQVLVSVAEFIYH